MKQQSVIIAIVIVIFSSFGCHKQLDVSPVSQVTSGNFYKTESDIEQAVIACYDALQAKGQYGQNFLYLMEVNSDNAKTSSITNSGGIYGDFDLFRVTANNAVLDQTWAACYLGIQRCNIVLNRIGAIAMADSTKNARIGEAKFIRALTYFNMVRIWGAVPLVTKETTNPFNEFDHGRDDVSVVYSQIIKDLTEAAAALPTEQLNNNVGRVTKGAAQALLGKVYLTQKNYSAAVTVLQTVVNSASYQLLSVYADIFKTTNKNNKESIFEVQFKKGSNGEGSAFANLFAQVNDGRKAATVGTVNGKNYCKKFIDASPTQNLDGGNNFIVLRFADVMLMLAEALNEAGYTANGSAFTYINQIRVRAGLSALTATTTPDQISFRLAIEKERKYELAFENHRWFDLLRTDRAIAVMTTTPSDNGPIAVTQSKLLFQIPQSQIDVRPGLILQNP
jgi:tetratricopeptide (TPR) repeat protein